MSQLSYLLQKFRDVGYEYDPEMLWKHLEKLEDNRYRYWLKLCYEKDVNTLKQEVSDWLKEFVKN